MEIEHISRQKFYRAPSGAVRCCSSVRLRLSLKDAGLPRSVRVIYMRDGMEQEYKSMSYVFTVAGSCIYESEIMMPADPCLIWYLFEIVTDGGIVYYGNNPENLGGEGAMSYNSPARMFQITVYSEDYTTPDWFKNGVAYQIFPDRFYNANPNGEFLGNRDDIIKRQWGETPFYKAEQFGGEYKSNDFFGGNLDGIRAKLPYLEELGITVIYLNPIFKAASNHKYDTGDYEEIDPMFGDEESFVRLCSEAKKRGIRIILDGVFNHTGDDSKYFNKYGKYDSIGAYESKNSPYYSWYRFMDYPDDYESWWGMTTLPQINEDDESFLEYLIRGENSIIKKWIRLGASGWRLDVADELPDSFIKELRRGVKEVDPEAVIIGEVWEDASNKIAYSSRREYFYGEELDSVMNYPLRNALIDASLCRIDAQEFDRRIMSIKENYPAPAYYSTLNITSTHDVERIVTLMGGVPTRHEVSRDEQASFRLDGYTLKIARDRTKIAVGVIMTMPGVPCIFYGDELGVEGYGDPFCRSCFPWGNEEAVDPCFEMRSWVKDLIKLRKSSKALSIGEMDCIYSIGYTYGYIREYEGEKYVIIANFDSVARDIRIDTARHHISHIVCEMSSSEGDGEHNSDDGIFFIKTAPRSVMIYKAE